MYRSTRSSSRRHIQPPHSSASQIVPKRHVKPLPTMFSLPPELIIKILRAAGAKSTISFRSTCRHFWHIGKIRSLWLDILKDMYIQRGVPPPSKRLIHTFSDRKIESLAKAPLRAERCFVQVHNRNKVDIAKEVGRMQVASHYHAIRPETGEWHLIPGGKYAIHAYSLQPRHPLLRVNVLHVDNDEDLQEIAGRYFQLPGDYTPSWYSIHLEENTGKFLVTFSGKNTTETNTAMYIIEVQIPEWRPLDPIADSSANEPPSPPPATIEVRMTFQMRQPIVQMEIMKGVPFLVNFYNDQGFLSMHFLGVSGGSFTGRGGYFKTPFRAESAPLLVSRCGPAMVLTSLVEKKTIAYGVFPFIFQNPSNQSLRLPHVVFDFSTLNVDPGSVIAPDPYTVPSTPLLLWTGLVPNNMMVQSWFDERTGGVQYVWYPTTMMHANRRRLVASHVSSDFNTTIMANEHELWAIRLPNPTFIPRGARTTASPQVLWQSHPPMRILTRKSAGLEDGCNLFEGFDDRKDYIRVLWDEATGTLLVGTFGDSPSICNYDYSMP